MFAPMAAALLLTSVIHAPQTGLTAQLWENVKNVVIYIPLFSLPFFLTERTQDQITTALFRVIVGAAIAQCIFVTVYHALGGELWLYGLYAGFIGNPNSFALFLNLATAVILTRLGRLTGAWLVAALASLALISSALLGTTSGSQVAVFIAIFGLTFLFRWENWRKLLAAAAVCAAVFAAHIERVQDTAFTLEGAGSAIVGLNDPDNEPAEGTSLSVTGRLTDITDALSVLSAGFSTAAFGSFENTEFRPMDGQFWVFLYNGGLLAMLTFAAGSAFVYVRSLGPAWKTQDDDALALHLVIVAFGVTFIASRVLMYFPFNFLFFLLAGLAVARSMRPRQNPGRP